MMQEDYDQELAQAIHQHEQSQGAEPHPSRQHPQSKQQTKTVQLRLFVKL